MSEGRANLIKMLPKYCIGCEIGVWQGEFSNRLYNELSIKEMHLIDPWQYDMPEFKEKKFFIANGRICQSQEDYDKIYESVVQRFAGENIIIHRAKSQDVAHKFTNEFFDFVYIDGGHSFEQVTLDIYNYWPKIKIGGFLTGDDWNWTHDDVCPVKDAVLRFVKKLGIKVIDIDGTQWLVKKEQA